MKAYMTNGTIDFLLKKEKKHPDLHFLFMQNNNKTIAYYEDTESTVFETARNYEVIVSKGDIKKEGFVVINNIPVTDEGRPIFETQFKNRAGMIDGSPGFQALRVLRPLQGNIYIVLVEWADELSYETWKNSESFANSHKKPSGTKERPPYSAGPSYAESFHVVEEQA
ncbi:antibiotic biosynthesis monooxygenase family protein [Aquibacillus kalidii]|uniref:antibiotic biosynthesis monooxygenase family protein n=1 Tax=Aquibacillus kalidii TaxID=2762597 RepID=UPI00164910D9|nr:antibiotic biosynthesis monooxygenase [Aquibacillus kalidii]